MTEVLRTNRLILREMSGDDLDFVAEMLANPEVMKYWPKCYSRQESADWIKRQQDRYARDGVGYWLALNKDSHQPIGQAGLLALQVDGSPELGLGYIIHRPFWRMGYATDAAKASRDYGFEKLRKKRIIALIRPANEESQGVARKLGMKLEKKTHYADYDHLVFVAEPS
jgi:ribosomal-protein-alanine N-acetyltransferase